MLKKNVNQNHEYSDLNLITGLTQGDKMTTASYQISKRLCLLRIMIPGVAAGMTLLVGCTLSDTAKVSPSRMVFNFESGKYACEGAANPFPAAGHVSIVDTKTSQGKALRFGGQDEDAEGRARYPWDKSAMIIDGVNLPLEKGTIGLKVRWSGARNWSDGRRTWLLLIIPQVIDTKPFDEGTGLALIKDEKNNLILAEYQFYDGRLTHYLTANSNEVAEPDSVSVTAPTDGLKADDWVPVRIAWNRKDGKVWLGLGDKILSGDVRFRASPLLCLLVGTPPKIWYSNTRGFDGDIDDLIIDARTPEETAMAGFEMPKPLPPMARPPSGIVPAVLLKGNPLGEKMESVVRSHLANMMRAQIFGGWAFNVAWPSNMRFMSTKVVIPISRNYFNGSKNGNSSYCAQMLLSGYFCLGDKVYLEAAEKTAETLLKIQQPEGYWPYGVKFIPGTDKYEIPFKADCLAPLEDHVQSHPTALLWLLSDLTGKEKYKAAADNGRDFILRAQNPNGSWSHRYNLELKCGQASRRKDLRAGEINDYTTSDQMMIMLLAYRRTGEIKYLASYLRGADWLVSAFVDKKAKGWAQQYDENNNPTQARHFEPAAVSLSEGIRSTPLMLLQTYRMTGDRKYIEPCRKWRQWMLDNRIFTNKEKTAWGWHNYYDPEDGKAFKMEKRVRLEPDPREVREGNFTSALREIETADQPVKKVVPSLESARTIVKAEEALPANENDPTKKFQMSSVMKSFNWEAGSWLYGNKPSGLSFSPSTIRVAFVARSVFLRRQIAGQIPINHRMATLEKVQWGNPFYRLVPPQDLEKPLTSNELAQARAYIAGPAAGKKSASE
ncbi:MAG: hypothetical protein Q7J98_04460 [Kiritimatiellia bacterium]|nr:hypothetical protein [Kiritimatiellia bacterium]